MEKLNANLDDVVDYLVSCDDEDFAEVFARYYYLTLGSYPYDCSEDMPITAQEMLLLNTDELTKRLKGTLDEIILSDDVRSDAWWKLQRQL